MTQDQIVLLLRLRDSKERGAASLSCSQRHLEIAQDCAKQGWARQHKYGLAFFYITKAGLEALDKVGAKVRIIKAEEKKHVREEPNREVVTGRWEKDSSGKWVSVPYRAG